MPDISLFEMRLLRQCHFTYAVVSTAIIIDASVAFLELNVECLPSVSWLRARMLLGCFAINASYAASLWAGVDPVESPELQGGKSGK